MLMLRANDPLVAVTVKAEVLATAPDPLVTVSVEDPPPGALKD
jgi:hypothetical protein